MVSLNSVYSIVAGSVNYTSPGLILLAFSPYNRSISHVADIEGVGPHQFLTTTPMRDCVFGTSLARDVPASLVSWKVQRDTEHVVKGLEFINRVNITSSSGYITIPPPYTHAYSTGGPTGEVHEMNPVTGGFGKKVQQFAYISDEELETAEKGPGALITGGHGIEISSSGFAFASVMGTDAIEMYKRDIPSGRLTHLSTNINVRADVHDAERHNRVHPNGKILYGIAEDSNRVDVYDILPELGKLRFVSSHALVPASAYAVAGAKWRGDTAFLIPPSPGKYPTALIASTRGSDQATRGWVSIFRLNKDGYIVSAQADDDDDDSIIRFQTPTSGGLANDMDVRLKEEGKGVWILLTDADPEVIAGRAPIIRVLEWGGWNSGDTRIRVVAQWPASFPDGYVPVLKGASRPLWLD